MDVILKVLSSLATVIIALAFIFYAASRNEIKKDESLQRSSARGVVKMKRSSGMLLGIGGVLILLAIAFPDGEKEVVNVEKTDTETVQADTEKENEEVLALDTYEIAAIPINVPSAYKKQYEELVDIISRADATLGWVQQNIALCETPCSKSLDEIETKFDSMSEVIEKTRSELLRGSEIARHLANEDPEELNTQKLYELEQEMIATRYSLETMLIADSWESWEEPIEYAESTKTKRLFKINLADTLFPNDNYTEGSTYENGEPSVNEETPEALQSAKNVILGFRTIEEEVNALVDSVYESSDADFLTGDEAIAFINSTQEQAVIASNAFNDDNAAKELSGAIGQLDSLKAKILKYQSVMENSKWNLDTYDEVLMIVDTFYDDLDFNPVTVQQFLELYGL